MQACGVVPSRSRSSASRRERPSRPSSSGTAGATTSAALPPLRPIKTALTRWLGVRVGAAKCCAVLCGCGARQATEGEGEARCSEALKAAPFSVPPPTHRSFRLLVNFWPRCASRPRSFGGWASRWVVIYYLTWLSHCRFMGSPCTGSSPERHVQFLCPGGQARQRPIFPQHGAPNRHRWAFSEAGCTAAHCLRPGKQAVVGGCCSIWRRQGRRGGAGARGKLGDGGAAQCIIMGGVACGWLP